MQSVKVKYIGKGYASFFGDKEYEAKPRFVRGKEKIPVVFQIVDPDGDTYTVANGTIEEGLKANWIVVSDY